MTLAFNPDVSVTYDIKLGRVATRIVWYSKEPYLRLKVVVQQTSVFLSNVLLVSTSWVTCIIYSLFYFKSIIIKPIIS